MRYLGGKFRQARHIASVIHKLSSEAVSYYEPFLGGASVLDRIAPLFRYIEASDAHLDLMMMWQACAGGWWLPPVSVSTDEYIRLRDAVPSAQRGFVGFGCSYGGKWFGGYAREKVSHKHTGDICAASRNSVMRSSIIMRQSNAKLIHRSYAELDPKPGSLIYCDPPYADSTGYAGMPEFDHADFWDSARTWAASGCMVLISEYTAPEDAQLLHSMAARKSVGSNLGSSVESLFALGVDTRYHSLLQ